MLFIHSLTDVIVYNQDTDPCEKVFAVGAAKMEVDGGEFYFIAVPLEAENIVYGITGKFTSEDTVEGEALCGDDISFPWRAKWVASTTK